MISSEITIYLGCGLVVLIVFIFIFSNIASIIKLSGKIHQFEDEIEKKGIEFDSLRKEKNHSLVHDEESTSSSHDISGQTIEPADNLSINTVIVPKTENQEIEIVRNVRGGFDSQNAGNLQVFSATAAHAQQENTPKQHDPVEHPSIIPSESDVMDIVTDSEPVLSTIDDNQGKNGADPYGSNIVLHLYSDLKKDADFAAAWQQLAQFLPSSPSPAVTIDFTRVMFLYEKEIGYLNGIFDMVTQQKGSLILNNLDPELKNLLSKDKRLSSIIKD